MVAPFEAPLAVRRALALVASLLAAGAGAAEPGAPQPGTGEPVATVVVAARSIGSKRGAPLDPRAHGALLVRIEGRPGGFIVQGGKEPGRRALFGARHRVVGWAIPSGDPEREFAVAVGGYWGEPGARELPTQSLATFTVPGLDEAKLRALVEALNAEFRDRDYALEGGPSSNSFVSRALDRLGLPLPPLGAVELPGWGWRP